LPGSVVELKNRPGALAKAVEKLARARTNIRYAYATASSRTRRTAAVVAVPDVELSRALQLLGQETQETCLPSNRLLMQPEV
jgi:hypothetical protein